MMMMTKAAATTNGTPTISAGPEKWAQPITVPAGLSQQPRQQPAQPNALRQAMGNTGSFFAGAAVASNIPGHNQYLYVSPGLLLNRPHVLTINQACSPPLRLTPPMPMHRTSLHLPSQGMPIINPAVSKLRADGNFQARESVTSSRQRKCQSWPRTEAKGFQLALRRRTVSASRGPAPILALSNSALSLCTQTSPTCCRR